MNKEDRYSHLVPMDQLCFKFSLYLHHTTQNIIIKKGKNDTIVWDGSTLIQPIDIIMKEVTPVAHKVAITCGHVKIRIYIDIRV
jgi:hypothetical protein